MTAIKEKIVEKIDRLPESMLNEVLDFVEFLYWKVSNEEENPLLEISGILLGDPISSEDIERELYENEQENLQ